MYPVNLLPMYPVRTTAYLALNRVPFVKGVMKGVRHERGQVIHFAEFQKFKRLTRSVSQNSLKTGILQYESLDPFYTISNLLPGRVSSP